MFELRGSWVWDFWFADDGDAYHLFFLHAPRSLGDPDRRHAHASIGHAVSADLVHWERVADALARSGGPAFDDVATWTGSVTRHPDGRWFLFYTGVTRAGTGRNAGPLGHAAPVGGVEAARPPGLVQSIGVATSPDLMTWTRGDANPVLRADGTMYETATTGDGAFRDPFVLPDARGGWHMLFTARAPGGPADDAGVVGHAWSADLQAWRLRPPLSAPGQGFGHLEVMQSEIVDGCPVLIFSCRAEQLSRARRAGGTRGVGVWATTGRSILGPWDIRGAVPVTDRTRYSGRIVRDRDGRWQLVTFHCDRPDGSFAGVINDPVPFSVPRSAVGPR